jgi:hypothetical protein
MDGHAAAYLQHKSQDFQLGWSYWTGATAEIKLYNIPFLSFSKIATDRHSLGTRSNLGTIKNCYPSASSAGKSRAKLRFEKPSAQLSTTLWTLICQVAGCWLRLSAWRKRWNVRTRHDTTLWHCGHQKGGTTGTNGPPVIIQGGAPVR